MSTLIYTPFIPKYLSFSYFKWTTTYGCVCRHILEYRLTHFAPHEAIVEIKKDKYLGMDGV